MPVRQDHQHSPFVPAILQGAKPYHRRRSSGAWLIGTTAHYVFDAGPGRGPIIEQETGGHSFHECGRFRRHGRDINRVLARNGEDASRHASCSTQDRVFCNNQMGLRLVHVGARSKPLAERFRTSLRRARTSITRWIVSRNDGTYAWPEPADPPRHDRQTRCFQPAPRLATASMELAGASGEDEICSIPRGFGCRNAQAFARQQQAASDGALEICSECVVQKVSLLP